MSGPAPDGSCPEQLLRQLHQPASVPFLPSMLIAGRNLTRFLPCDGTAARMGQEELLRLFPTNPRFWLGRAARDPEDAAGDGDGEERFGICVRAEC